MKEQVVHSALGAPDGAPSKEISKRGVVASWVLLALLMGVFCAPLFWTVALALSRELPEQQAAHGALALAKSTLQGVKRVLGQDPPGRTQLKALYDQVRIRTLRSSPNPKVVVGQGDWLFYLEPDSGLPTYVHDRPLSQADLKQWRNVIEQRVAFFGARGVTYLMVMAPSKSSVHPQRIPDRIRQRSAEGRFDQILAGLSPRVREHVLDLRGPLRAQAQTVDNYYRLDSHWNDEGAYLGYQEMVRRLAALSAQGQHPLPREWERPVQVTHHRVRAERDDLAAMLNRPYFWSEWTTALRPAGAEPERFLIPMQALSTLRDPKLTEQSKFYPYGRSQASSPHLPRCVAFRDSFFHIIEPYFARHCQRLILLKHPDKLQTPVLSLDMKLLAAERPQIVVEEFVERLLNRSYAFAPKLLTPADMALYTAPSLEAQSRH